jgi:hypothetical protein
VEVLLAVIPYEEFGVHISSVMPGDSLKAYKDAVKRRAEARKRFGWKGEAKPTSTKGKHLRTNPTLSNTSIAAFYIAQCKSPPALCVIESN